MMGYSEMELDAYRKISSREKECLLAMIRRRSSSQIAEELGIKKRTVEHYIENIKNKFACSKKSELFDQILYAKELGLLN